MATTHPSTFGSLLKRYRLAAGLTQEELAERARLSPRAVSDLERGVRRRPYRDTVEQLADALALDAAERADLHAVVHRVGEGVDPAPRDDAPHRVRTNLTPESTTFIGREREMAAILALLAEPGTRLVTLTGPGGIGKTRLSLHLAAHLLDAPSNGAGTSYPDGVFFIALASVGDPSLVPSAIASALDLQQRGGEDLVPQVIEHLRTRRLLLVLDNFEHLLAARTFLGELLEACPTLHLLVTSRTVLHLSWEHAFEVPPLRLPDLDGNGEGAVPATSEAVAFFVDRARAVRADFVMTPENADAVAQICRYLEGMPLAIELAAARLRLFPPQALLNRLSQRLQFLTGGAHDLPARHQTLRAAIDWSYSLLDEAEQQLFARLSVFRGGCTLDAAEVIGNRAGDLGDEVLGLVSSLVEKSLLRQVGTQEPRMVMLETIREYAAERLEEMGIGAEVRAAHARWYLVLAEEAAPELQGPEQAEWLERLEAERDNLRAALQWARESGDTDLGLRLAIALSGFWMIRGPLSEGRGRLERLAGAGGGTPVLQAAAFFAAGKLAGAEGYHRAAAELVERSLHLYRQVGERRGAAEAMGRLAVAWFMSGEVEQAVELLRQSELQGRETGDTALLAASLRFLAAVASEQTDPQQTRHLGEESLALYRTLGDREGVADVLRILASAAYASGDRRPARALTDELLNLLRESPLASETQEWLEPLAYQARKQGDYAYATHIFEALRAGAEVSGDRRIAAHAWAGLALLAREQGDFQRASALYDACLTALDEVGDILGRSRALNGLSDIARDQGDAERMISLSQESLALLQEIGDAFQTGYALHNLAVGAWFQGDRSRAETLLAEAIALFQRQGVPADISEILASVGQLALDAVDYDRAARAFAEGLMTTRKSEACWMLPTLLEGMAGAVTGMGQADLAARLLGAAEAARQEIGIPRWPALQSLYDRTVAAALAGLGQERYLEAVEIGRAMTLEEAVSLVLEEHADVSKYQNAGEL